LFEAGIFLNYNITGRCRQKKLAISTLNNENLNKLTHKNQLINEK